jgi:hypothetical protein
MRAQIHMGDPVALQKLAHWDFLTDSPENSGKIS